MQDHYHAIVWVDHREARIFHVSASDVDRVIVHSHGGGQNLHHKANARDSGHLRVDKDFFERIVGTLTHTGAILITGPANAKTELQRYMRNTAQISQNESRQSRRSIIRATVNSLP